MSQRPTADFAQMQLRTLLKAGATEPAVLFEDRWTTWGDLAELAHSVESELKQRGIPRRAPIVLVPRNRPSSVAALLGLIADDRVPELVSPIQPGSSIAHAIEVLAPVAVILESQDLVHEIRLAAERCGALCMTISDEVTVVDSPAELRVDPGRLVGEHVALVVPTSGTTGPPKPIELKWSQMPFDPSKGVRLPVAPDVRPPVINALSIATITGVMGVLRTAALGRVLALLERVDVDQWSKLVERFRLRRAGLPPAAMRTMLDVGIPPERLASLKSWQTGSAPLAPELQREFEETYGVPVLVAYGATEFGGAVASWNLALHREWSEHKLGSVGRAVDGIELRIVDEDTGAVLPAGQIGVLDVFVPGAGGNDRDGWMRTNDRARIDEDGFLFILGRVDDVIIRGGFKVPLGELEDLFRRHPAIRDVAAVGLPEPRLGHVPGLAVVLKAGSSATADELRSWARERTAPYKVPTVIAVFDSLPMSASHKVNRVELRERLTRDVSTAVDVG